MCFYDRAYVDQEKLDRFDRNAFEIIATPKPSVDPARQADTSDDQQPVSQLKPEFERQRNEIIGYLLNISDSNCNNFLDRLFAKQTSVSFVKGLTNVVTSPGAALTAFASVPAAAGLNATNAIFSGGADAINTDIYYSKTAPDIAQAIRNRRAQIREDITLRELGTTPAAVGHKASESAQAKAKTAQEACAAAEKATKTDADKVTNKKFSAKTKAAAIKKLSTDIKSQITRCQESIDAAASAKDAQDAATKLASASTQFKASLTPYTLSTGIADVIEYDSQCSMLGGLSNLSQAVAATNPEPMTSKQSTSAAPSTAPTPKPKK
jgi:hypothetical protein